MTTIDLRQDGLNFALLSNTITNENEDPNVTKSLPNYKLSQSLQRDLDVIYKALFGSPLPMTEESFSFMVSYRDKQFSKVHVPCVMRGNADVEAAPDPDKLYVRWGDAFAPLAITEEEVKKKKFLSIADVNGEDLDYLICGYTYLKDFVDPSLQITVGDVTMNLLLRVVIDETQEKSDYVAAANSTVTKQGLAGLLDMIVKVSNKVEYAPTYNVVAAAEQGIIKPNVPYEVVDIINKPTSNGKMLRKLVIADEETLETIELWTPYGLRNFLDTNPSYGDDRNPVFVYYGTTTVEYNDTTYVNEVIGFTHPESAYYANQNVELLAEETEEMILKPFRYAKTYKEGDLEIGDYTITSVKRMKISGSDSYKFKLSPEEGEGIFEIWCPSKKKSSIPVLFGELDYNVWITPEIETTFSIVDKTVKGDRTYAVSVINNKLMTEALNF